MVLPAWSDQRRALLDLLDAGRDQRLDLLGRLGAALRQAAHLAGHHREAAALFAGARGFHRGVERQDVGLEGDAVDGADDVGDAARAVVDAVHRLDHLAHHVAAWRAFRLHRGPQPLSSRALVASWLAWRGVVGVVAHGGAQLLHRRGGLLQRAGLLLGALAQVLSLPCAICALAVATLSAFRSHAADHGRPGRW
jgi:hypothetical protein